MRKHCYQIFVLFVLFFVFANIRMPALADNNSNENIYYIGETVNTGKDNGFSQTNKITEKDLHYGWTLGSFFVKGYTRQTKDNEGNIVFLKNVGDKVGLFFSLKQDITRLNNDENMSITSDFNTYDEYFGIGRTNFGRGALFVRKINRENEKTEPAMYFDYLYATALKDANTEVGLFEEGDYEVALDYEVEKKWTNLLNQNLLKDVSNYRIYFKFSIRNGNTMVFLLDKENGRELSNNKVTANGFKLDLAKSLYLDVDVKKEILTAGANGLTEDVRFNRVAKDGDVFTDEGIYTITVKNNYSNQQVVKKIYVGTDSISMAHVNTGYSIEKIRELLSQGYEINNEGNIVEAQKVEVKNEDARNNSENEGNSKVIPIVSALFMLIVVAFILVKSGVLKRKPNSSIPQENNVFQELVSKEAEDNNEFLSEQSQTEVTEEENTEEEEDKKSE